MEILDLFNNRKERINKTFVRDDGETEYGEYRLTLHMWIINDKHEILIQKRSPNMKRNPGKWAFTGGLPLSGEESIDGALREIKEELGLKLNKEDIELLITFRREHDFVDVWIAKSNVDLKDLVLQEREVAELKWVTLEELEEIIINGEFVSSVNVYYDFMKKLLYKSYFKNMFHTI